MPPIPPEVTAALAGASRPSAWDTVVALLTVDDEAVPDVCLLSRTELDCTPERILAAVASSKARANLGRCGRATLWVWTPTPTYLALRVVTEMDAGELTGYEFELTRVLIDDLGVDLRPAQFHVEAWLVEAEQWQRSAALLARLRAASSG
jgi:hypothetical protein